MNQFDLFLSLCKEDAKHKDASHMMLKLTEEVGELAREVQIDDNVYGSRNRTPGPDGFFGEAADVLIAFMATVFVYSEKRGYSLEYIESEMDNRIQEKLTKWEGTVK